MNPATFKPVSVPPEFSYQGQPIVMIEYLKTRGLWMPHEVVVSCTPEHPYYYRHYDFDYSHCHSSLYFHWSGGGGAYVNGWPNAKKPQAKLWLNPEAFVEMTTGGGEQLHTASHFEALGFELLQSPIRLNGHEMNPFHYGIEGEVLYCTKCRDHVPEDEPCEHIFWCERCNEWGGAEGNKESCRHRKPKDVLRH